MSHRANTSQRWTEAEDEILAQAKRDRLASMDIVVLLPGRSVQSIDNRVGTLRLRGVDVGRSRRGKISQYEGSPDRDREFDTFRARTTAASAALLAAIINLSNRGNVHA